MDAAEAASLVARAAVEMTGALTKKSAGAARQQRYRERNKASQSVTQDQHPSVTNRNESVTPLRTDEASQNVTNRNEGVTSDGPSLSKEEKKEVIKEKRESRAAQLPDGWTPLPKHWDEAVSILGSSERADLEFRKFKLHAADKGRVAKNWNAAWVKWAIQAIEYGARNGNGTSNHRADPAAGRATAREAQHVAAMGGAALRYLQEGKSAGSVREASSDTGSAEVFDFGKRAENAR
ncbi:hypothetical protein IVB50_27530 [Bradyrhizobium sp. 87]|nr:hypothetical protein [Bradyrhizobium sp. 87]